MRRLTVFNQQSIDGYFCSRDGDVSWTHATGGEDRAFREFSEANARSNNTLVFGRKTYEMMASFWPSPMAAQQFPVLAAQMNALAKIVFSRTLDRATWNNTTIASGDLVTEIRRLKSEPGKDLTILGSGSLVAQLVHAGLVDELGIMVIPIVLGAGRSMFGADVTTMTLTKTQAFHNGRVYLRYEPTA